MDFMFECNIPEISDAINYMLQDGKKLRANIIYELGNKSDISVNFARSVEYLHNASLIFDDLPCMDNAKIRRNKDCLHIHTSEHIAQLSAITLLGHAQIEFYRGLKLLKQKLPNETYELVYEFLNNEYLSVISDSGLSGGQYHDLTVKNYIKSLPLRKQQETILNIMKLKTGVLFSLTFIMGYLADYHIINIQALQTIKNIGLSVGMCYQIIDDL